MSYFGLGDFFRNAEDIHKDKTDFSRILKVMWVFFFCNRYMNTYLILRYNDVIVSLKRKPYISCECQSFCISIAWGPTQDIAGGKSKDDNAQVSFLLQHLVYVERCCARFASLSIKSPLGRGGNTNLLYADAL